MTKLITVDPKTLQAVVAAALEALVHQDLPEASAEVGALVARGTEASVCTACGNPTDAHFNNGRMVGCAQAHPMRRATDVLHRTVQVARDRSNDAAPQRRETAPRTSPLAGVAQPRFRYTSALHHRTNIAKLDLSPTRAKVLQTIHDSGKAGLLSRDIIKKAGLPHGSVQQTLNWLRNHKQVRARKVAKVA